MRTLDEAESKNCLAPYGLVLPQRWAGAAEDAPAAAAGLGFPVAVKVLDGEIAHKSKLGGVHLNLGSQIEVSEAIARIRRDVARARSGAQLDRFLVESMAAAPVHELILGIKRHEELGLALLIGRGGVDAEILRDYTLVLLPASDRAFARALDRLQIPGLSPSASQAILDSIRAVARFAMDHADGLVELDVNPLLVLEDQSAVAVDALIVLCQAPGIGGMP